MDWLEPWYSVTDNVAKTRLGRELQRELAPGHPLFGVQIEAMGHRCDRDDVVFRLLDGTNRVAVVHLTWTRSPPDRLPFPRATIYDGIEQWIADRMIADHQEYTLES